ncbi:MAG: hypothetical protein CMK59_00630 [Proteobacteria bacterium]|nr:hypothetical protein [Pseudomonadota bacterium]
MWIDQHFDGGNIRVLECKDPQKIKLAIRQDKNAEFAQWFSFHLHGAKNKTVTIIIENASQCSYPKGWENYSVRHSIDGSVWNCTPTRYEQGRLIIEHTPLSSLVHYAYFAPYPWSRHQNILQYAARHGAKLHHLGCSIEGRPMTELSLGHGPKQVWIIARQHPGETMAQWWVEGFLSRLIKDGEPFSKKLKELATIHIVPNMNPDGSVHGNLRTNAKGINLNRVWNNPSVDTEPEVFYVRKRMLETGVSVCFDVHGDEGLPYNFFAFPWGIPSLSEQQTKDFDRLSATMCLTSPEFQTKYGYPRPAPGKGHPGVCSCWVAEHFNCTAVTLEQPFKDNAILPDPKVAWSPQRAAMFGASSVQALYLFIKESNSSNL